MSQSEVSEAKGCHDFLLVSESEVSEAKGCPNFLKVGMSWQGGGLGSFGEVGVVIVDGVWPGAQRRGESSLSCFGGIKFDPGCLE